MTTTTVDDMTSDHHILRDSCFVSFFFLHIYARPPIYPYIILWCYSSLSLSLA